MRAIPFVIGLLVALAIVVDAVSQPEPATEQPAPLTIRFPKTKTYVNRESVRVIGLVNDSSIQQVRIQVGDKSLDAPVPVQKGAFEATVPLAVGLNEIVASSSENDDVRATIQLFRAVPANEASIPKGFEEYYLHKPLDKEASCQSCHRLDTTPVDYQRMKITGATCQTSECHSNIGEEKYVHGPTAGGTCIACHNPHGSTQENHVSRTGSSLCLVCHEDIADQLDQPEVHGVIEMSGCTDCHNPHESPNEFLLEESPVRELCFSCHDDEKAQQKVVHGPVAAGDCTVCHSPHASPNAKLLAEKGNDLCFLCHDLVEEDTKREYEHQPVTDSCTTCHDPHGSPNEKLLNQADGTLCLDCHDDIQERIQTVTVEHRPVADGSCTKCHVPHGSDYSELLKSSTTTLCFSCHTQLGKQVAESKYRHGPVEQDDCYACHEPHGSDNPKILAKYFPPQFYTSYGPEKYALCFECHNKYIALDERTTTLTDFRNGDRNLHFLHVNKTRKGRSCKACHDVHASNQPAHIRTEVPYGKMWSYSIKYTKTEYGGKCVVGCHKPKEYNRVDPVTYE